MTKISQYPNLPTPQNSDNLVIVDNSGSPVTKKTTRLELLTGTPISGATVSGSTVEWSTASGIKQASPLLDINGNPILSFTPVASAVNHLDIADAAAGSKPTLSAIGSDANIGLAFAGKGTGAGDFGNLMKNAVQTQANAGTGGGTMYYINLGGIKLLWGRTAQYTGLGAGAIVTLGVTFPSSFFNSITGSHGSLNQLGGVANQSFYGNSLPTTTAWVLTAANNSGSGGASGYVDYFVIGT